MSNIELSLACGEYEILRSLADGGVRPAGIDLIVLNNDKERIFRLDRRNECQVAEFNIVQYLKARDAGVPLTAIPVFPHRRFRHGSIFINSAAGISAPEDLRGRAVGVGGFEPAAVVWIRGMLSDQYGIGHDEIDWVDVYGRLGRLPDGQTDPMEPSDGRSRQRIDDLLLDGTISALASAYNPPAFSRGDLRLMRLFPDYVSKEADYFRATGIFPVMHVVTISEAVADQYPWVPASLFEAFTRAKALALDRMRDPRYLPLAFVQDVQARQTDLLGSDPWAYGLTEGNRRAVAAISRYCAELGLIASVPSVDELFEPTDDYSGDRRLI